MEEFLPLIHARHLLSNMSVFTLPGEIDLPMTLPQSYLLLLTQARVAFWAGDAFLVFGRIKIILLNWPTATKTEGCASVFQTVDDRYLMMKDEALAFPTAFFGIDLLQIIEDAPAKMIDFVESILQ